MPLSDLQRPICLNFDASFLARFRSATYTHKRTAQSAYKVNLDYPTLIIWGLVWGPWCHL
jgi:hypothetical protein